MYLKGWRGICVDADPISVEALRQHRPGDICLHAGVGRTRGAIPFYRFEGGAVSTFDEASRDTWIRNGSRLASSDLVDIVPLGELLKPILRKGQKVDYLNIDVEGHDMDALETYDFENFAPNVISVETEIDLHNPSSNPAFSFLSKKGYRLASHAIITSIYVKA